MMGPRHPDVQLAPEWLKPLMDEVATIRAEQLSRFTPPADGSGRHSAILMLFASPTDEHQADVLLLRRASTLRSHAGQVAFPGGATDSIDLSASDTALREAEEEVGLDRSGVDVLAELPALFLPPSGFVVTPVLGYWREPSPIGVVDTAEVARVQRVPITSLVDPVNRFTVRHPSGFLGPAFEVEGLFVWGFTAGLLDRLIRLAGWEQPWDRSVSRPFVDGLAD